MAFAPLPNNESPNEAFLSPNNNGEEDDNFAALDSMAPHSNFNSQQFWAQQQQGGGVASNAVVPHSLYNNTQTNSGAASNAVVPHSLYNTQSSNASSGGGSGGIGAISDGREGGFSGVSESLFDRIRARAAEQQKQQQAPPQQHQTPSPQQSQQSAFQSQQPSEPSMELEKFPGSNTTTNNAFASAPAPGNSGNSAGPSAFAPNNNSNVNANANSNETTYSFSGPTDLSSAQPAAAPHIPTYGPSRNDPHYSSYSSSNQQHPSSIQDKAAVAWEKTSSTMKGLWAGASVGATKLMDAAQNTRGGEQGASGRGYNNNFLLRDDHDEGMMEQGHMGGGGTVNTNVSSVSSPSMNPSTEAAASAGGAVGDQAYSIVSYGKTFCEDVYGFVMELPFWGKGLLGVVLIWAFFTFLKEEL